MSFEAIPIARPTPRVLGKLRHGGRVRVMKGEGMCLIVHSSRFNPITRSFARGKAYTVSLSPEEINANMRPPEQMAIEGAGLFDDIKKGAKKLGKDIVSGTKKVGKALAPVGKEVGKVLLPVGKTIAKEATKEIAKNGGKWGSALGASALSGLALLAGQPELVPVATAVGSKLGKAGGDALGKAVKKKADDRIDKFDPYKEQKGNKAPPSRSVSTPSASYDDSAPRGASQALAGASMANYLSSLATDQIETELARRRGGGYSTPFDESGGKQVLSKYTDAVGAVGQGLYAQGGQGRGLRGRSRGVEKGSVGIHGNLIGYGMPPALMSQPYSSNFQMASRLPPAFAPIIHSGQGLYA